MPRLQDLERCEQCVGQIPVGVSKIEDGTITVSATCACKSVVLATYEVDEIPETWK